MYHAAQINHQASANQRPIAHIQCPGKSIGEMDHLSLVPATHSGQHTDIPLKYVVRARGGMAMTGDKRSHWYDRQNEKSAAYDPTFPRSFKLGDSPRSPTVWWVHEILAWLEARAAKSRVN